MPKAAQKGYGEYVEALNPKGYLANREITNLDGQYLIRGSKNTLIKKQEKVVTRGGTDRLGAEYTMNYGIRGATDWDTSSQVTRNIRRYYKRLEVWYEDAWRIFADTLPLTQEAQFAPVWLPSELIDGLVMVQGDDKVRMWSGGIAKIASFTTDTLTKTEYVSGSDIEFNDNGASADTIERASGGFLAADFQAGQTLVVTGSGTNDGEYTIASVTDTVITLVVDDELETEAAGASVVLKTPTGTWGASRFLTTASGTRGVYIGGVVYGYTGGENTGTLTGVTVDPTGNVTAGDYAFQALKETTPTELDGMRIDRIGVFNNHVAYGSSTSRLVQVSSSSDYDDLTFSTPRAPGEGFDFTGDAPPNGFTVDGDAFIVTCGKDYWYEILLELSSDQAEEFIRVKRYQTARGQAAVSQGAIVPVKRTTVYLSVEGSMDTVTRLERVSTDEEKPISDDIKDDLRAYDRRRAHGIYYENALFYTLPNEGVVLIKDLEDGFWHPPQTFPSISYFSIIEINGVRRLCGHSDSVNETYILFEGLNDLGATIEKVAAFGYDNHGYRFQAKVADEFASELYITRSTTVTDQVIMDFEGATDVREKVIDDSNDEDIFTPSATLGLGTTRFGYNPFGSSLTELSNIVKIRHVWTTTALDWYERARVFRSDDIDAYFEILAYGENTQLSENEPAFIH